MDTPKPLTLGHSDSSHQSCIHQKQTGNDLFHPAWEGRQVGNRNGQGQQTWWEKHPVPCGPDQQEVFSCRLSWTCSDGCDLYTSSHLPQLGLILTFTFALKHTHQGKHEYSCGGINFWMYASASQKQLSLSSVTKGAQRDNHTNLIKYQNKRILYQNKWTTNFCLLMKMRWQI